MISATVGTTHATLGYDPLDRLDSYNPGTLTRFVYDGGEVAAEIDSSGNIVKRYVRGDGADDALVYFNGSGTAQRGYWHKDERGSIIAMTNPSGGLAINRYDEYGIPASTNQFRFQYTGQVWLPEIGIQYSKARMYSPTLGRFLQTDPIGYGDGPNWYNYVGSDPVNGKDPKGTMCDRTGTITCSDTGIGYTIWVNPGGDSGGGSTGSSGANGDRGGSIDPGTCTLQSCPIVLPPLPTLNLPGSPNLSTPGSGDGLGHYAPLSRYDQALMDQLLGTWEFRYRAGDAFNRTMISGLEHGFFIWHNQSGSFTLSGIYTGTARNMGIEFWGDSFSLSGYWATYHVHPGWWPSAMGPSVGPLDDTGFNAIHHSIGILGTRQGVVTDYGY
jgi:RHS repeat-associated protein